MTPHLTIAYLTNRKEPMIGWFFDSLHLQTEGDYTGIKLVVVDFYAQACDGWTETDIVERKKEFSALSKCAFIHVPPKPSVWQGAFRRAKINYFAAANTRNTAFCLAPDGYLVFVDDLSVLLPGWLTEVRARMVERKVACGAYDKVLNLKVEAGEVKDFQFHPPGRDTRRDQVPNEEPFRCGGGWAFGCSIAIPTDALVTTNGFDEDCDSMGFEDVICGIMLERNGYELVYCPRMKTLESEERHFIEKPFARIIKKMKAPSNYPDSSHAILDWVMTGKRITAPNFQNMVETRCQVLAGEPFPLIQCPEHHWPDSQLICEMDQRR